MESNLTIDELREQLEQREVQVSDLMDLLYPEGAAPSDSDPLTWREIAEAKGVDIKTLQNVKVKQSEKIGELSREIDYNDTKVKEIQWAHEVNYARLASKLNKTREKSTPKRVEYLETRVEELCKQLSEIDSELDAERSALNDLECEVQHEKDCLQFEEGDVLRKLEAALLDIKPRDCYNMRGFRPDWVLSEALYRLCGRYDI
jgi:chromosome segregation ATPase